MRLVSISQLPSRPFDVQRDELKQVMMALNAKNILTVIDAPKQSRAETELPWPKEYSLVIGEITADHSVLSQAQTVFHPSRCANAGPSISLVAPGNCNELSGALVTGAAGLVLSAAKGISRLGIDELEKELNTAELKQILQSSGDQATPHDPQNNQANPSFQTQSGYGRINARSAIESVIQRKIPPLVRIVQPQAYDQIAPTAGQPFVITARVENKRHELAEWTLEYALGTQAEDDDFIPVSRGTIRKGEEIDVVGEIPSNGLISDPTAPPFTQYSASMTLRVSVAAETDGGLTQSEVRQIVFLHRDLYLLPGFPKALELDAALPAVFIDVNADDQDEMVLVSRDRKIHAINYGGEPVNGWPIDLTFTGHPAALSHGTLGLDSTPSLVIVTEDGAVDVIGLDRVRRTGYPIVFPITNNVHVRFPTILYDLDGDQNKELIVASENGQIMAWHSDAKPVAGFPIELDQIIGPLAVGHFGDSEKTGIVAASRKQLFLIDADDDDQFHIGQIWTLPEQKAPFALPTGPVIANVDQDDEDEILLAQVNGAVVRFDPPVADHTVLTSHARTNFGMGSQIRLDGPPVFCAQGQSSLGDLDREVLESSG